MRAKSLPVFVFLVSAFGMSWFECADADIRKTKHNFAVGLMSGVDLSRPGGVLGQAGVSGPREVCVFCHTPTIEEAVGVVGSDDRRLSSQSQAAKPLPTWQRAVKEAEFALFDDIGRNTPQRVVAIGSISVACLSCHDSNQALGVMANQNNHPFGVPYRGVPLTKASREDIVAGAKAVGESVREASYVLSDPDFHPARNATVNAREIWWVQRGESPVRSKDDLPVYPRRVVIGDESFTVPFIECTSCHDPHVERETFLRADSAGSRLCMTCHVK